MVRGTAICQNISQDTLYYLINDARIRKNWDKIFSRFELVEDFPETNSQIIYYAVKVYIYIYIYNLCLCLGSIWGQ